MPRKPSAKPWFHTASRKWCATVDGKRRYLDADYNVACRMLQDLLSKRRNCVQVRDWLTAPFCQLADEFLSDVKHRRQPDTYTGYRYRLLRALKVLGTKLRVGEIRRSHLAQIERELPGTGAKSPTTIRDTLATVQRVMAWAVEHDLLEVNPLLAYRKRNRIIEPVEFQALLRHSGPEFRRFLVAIMITGCRPGELRRLTWDSVDLDANLWIMPRHKTITLQREPRPRIVALPAPIVKLCRWLLQNTNDRADHVFLNTRGEPYTKGCLVEMMATVRTRAKISVKAGERIVIYSNRHSYGTQASGKVNAFELSELLGHTSVTTSARYVHLNAERLHDIQRRAQG